MSQYDDQATDFLNNTKTDITIRLLRHGLYFHGDTEHRAIYKVTLTRQAMDYSFTFGASLSNSKANIKPTHYGVLACLTVDTFLDYQDFCDQLGYIKEDKHIPGIYRSVLKQSNELKSMFNAEEIDMLNDIN